MTRAVRSTAPAGGAGVTKVSERDGQLGGSGEPAATQPDARATNIVAKNLLSEIGCIAIASTLIAARLIRGFQAKAMGTGPV